MYRWTDFEGRTGGRGGRRGSVTGDGPASGRPEFFEVCEGKSSRVGNIIMRDTEREVRRLRLSFLEVGGPTSGVMDPWAGWQTIQHSICRQD